MNIVTLSPTDLTFAAILILLLGIVSLKLRLGQTKQLFIASLRCTVQLLIMGFILKLLFAAASPGAVVVMALVMLLSAGQAVTSRMHRPLTGKWTYFFGVAAMFLSSFTVTLYALFIIIDISPWYTPQYAIPLLGMLLGNTMTGVALSMDTLTTTVYQSKNMIEGRLILGEKWRDAAQEQIRGAIRTGLTPIINSMATTGIVSLPGMMTGQILAGSPPMVAVSYQILIMLLIAAGTGFGVILAVQITAGHLFDQRHRLRLDRLSGDTV
ncbi:MAG: iron export ABC transporter permease subunit FetB [Proteobacteria bacterium]|nr:iron export ABC transporter permease subunit FetB [Pseudomonadota bacterium]MBU1638946.1 iron export ABC transporter permease subunit FetB [Pseudomonadota bacterium]